MSDPLSSNEDSLPLALELRIDALCQTFEAAWKSAARGGVRPRIEEWLNAVAGDEREPLLRELLKLDLHYRCGKQPSLAVPQRRLSECGSVLGPVLDPLPDAAGDTADPAADHEPHSTVPALPHEGAPRRSLTPAGSSLPCIPGYEVLGVLGRGGMGIVYQARHVKLKRLVALKMIRAGSYASEQELARFQAEAEVVARLQHPHIVQVYEVGEHHGLPFFALEYVDGGSLAQKLTAELLPARSVAGLVQTLARAVNCAHQRGIIHRDLKPANVLLTADGTPKVADFGLAKRVYVDAGDTQTGAILGTPSYMAPEQAAGRLSEVGPRADVYALGAILYACLTGRPPFRAETPADTLMQVLTDEPVPPRRLQPKVPRDLETICLKCLRKEPARRYASAVELADDLQRWLAGEPIRARPVSLGARGLKWAKRRPTAAALVLLAGLAVPGLLAADLLVERRLDAVRADDLVDMLQTADVDRVPETVHELARYRSWAEPRLAAVAARSAPATRERLRAGLALLPWDAGQVDYLRERLLTADSRELKVIREALAGHEVGVVPRLWEVLAEAKTEPGRRLRGACALAGLDPSSRQWSEVSHDVVARLVAEDPLLASGWAELLRPVKAELTGPLKAVFRDRKLTEQSHVAASVLAEFLVNEPQEIVQLLSEADPVQLGALAARLQPDDEQVVSLLRAQVVGASPEEKANAAATLVRLGHGTDVWPMLRHSSNPEVRTRLVHLLAPAGVDAGVVAERLARETDDEVRRALILSLGQYGRGRIAEGQQKALARSLLDLYRTGSDPGIHSAIDWLLRRWGYGEALQQQDAALATKEPDFGKRWYVNSQGHTLVVVPQPVEFQMGSPPEEHGNRAGEEPRGCKLRPFAIATKEVTVRQFQAFRRSQDLPPDHPVGGVDFQVAARYCLWLSAQEGIPPEEWCYDWDGREDGKVTVRKDYLAKQGYRLPTEEEWEYACRAGATTSRFFGDSQDLLRHYAWFRDNSEGHIWPVGQLEPNDLGLFDVLGNVQEWCSNCRGEGDVNTRVMRGAAYRYIAAGLRSGYREPTAATFTTDVSGFRIARSLAPGR
jgi:formylglycine-generating enzyme required for sulfatase activity